MLKPAERVLYRPTAAGGLGLIHLECRAMAILLRNFLELALNPKFRHSIYAELLYRNHVLMEDLGVASPPYYDENFWTTLRHYKEESNLNLTVLSIKQWTQILVNDPWSHC